MSCRHSHDARAQGTSAQIVHAIEALRLAANPEKGAWLSRLQKLPCQTEDVCELKTLCVHAYETHLGGFEQVRQATSIIGDADAGDARDTPDASAELMLNAMAKAQNGQRQLKAARRQTRACAENEAVIRQRYRL